MDIRSFAVETCGISEIDFLGRKFFIIPTISNVGNSVVQAMEAETPEFIPLDVITKTVKQRNGRPVVINHPTGESANTPEEFENRSVGFVFHSRIEDKKVKSDLYVDKEQLKVKAPDIHDELARNSMVQVSEGNHVYVNVNESGTHDGKDWFGRWAAIFPDHIALLSVGMLGACGVACGAPRCQGGKMDNRKESEGLSAATLSDWLRQALLEAEPGINLWIEDVYDASVVYQVYPDADSNSAPGLWERQYTINEDNAGVTLSGAKVAVRLKNREYEPRNQSASPKIGSNLWEKIKKVILSESDSSIESRTECGCHKEENKEMADPTTNATTTAVETPAEKTTTTETPTPVNTPTTPATPASTPEVVPPVTRETKPLTRDEYLATLPADIKETLLRFESDANEKKNQLIKRVMSASNVYTKEDLEGMKTEQLQKLARALSIVDFTPGMSPVDHSPVNERVNIPRPYDVALGRGANKEAKAN